MPILTRLWCYRQLILTMSRREITDRFAGQVFGWVWFILHPLAFMGLYIFVFAFVFKVDLDIAHFNRGDYTTYLLSGLVPWLGFQDVLVKSGTSVTSQPNLVKQVVFPLEVLPVKTSLVSLVPVAVSFLALLAYSGIHTGTAQTTFMLLPLLVLLQLVMMVAMAFLLSSLGVFIRDVKDIMQMFALFGLFLTPIFYMPEAVPELFRPILFFNPFSHFVWCYQDILFYGELLHPVSWIVVPVVSVGLFTLGFAFFNRTRGMFGDLL